MGKTYLVFGMEARDHALAWKLAQSPDVDTVYFYPGNLAAPYDDKIKRLPESTVEQLADFATEHGVACTIVGDSHVKERRLVDLFTQRGLPVLGAHTEATMLEGSKAIAKAFMHRHHVPTATYRVCNDPGEVDRMLEGCPYPLVLKSDLRVPSPRSAIIVQDEEQARHACRAIFDMQKMFYGEAPLQILFEEFLSGREMSYTILTDGTHWTPMISVRDYKRRYEDDTGSNTAGMGSYAPVPWLTPDMEQRIAREIIEPTLAGLRAEGLAYRGFLYIGIMVDAHGRPRVLEYNTRLGDTEAETILMMLEDDFAAVALQAATGSIAGLHLHWKPGVAVSIAVVPEGYPESYLKTPVSLPLPMLEHGKCFGAYIRSDDENRFITGAGRFACVSVTGEDATTARKRAYDSVRRLDGFGRLCYRKDIALELEELASCEVP